MKNGKIYLFLFFLIVPTSFLTAQEKVGKKGYAYTRKILSYGVRSLGTQGHKRVQEYLSKKMKKLGLKVHSTTHQVKTPTETVQVTNWIGELQPKNPRKKEHIIFLAHYDSKQFSDFNFLGADDSASAVGLLLALAEYFVKKPLETTTLEFVFLDAEESFGEWDSSDSLYGSRSLSQLWSEQGRQEEIRAMILLDMVGGKDSSFCKESHSDTAITNEIWFLAAQKGLQNIFQPSCYSSVEDDHIPFIQEGFPIIDIIAYPFPSYWHTQHDTLKNISSKKLSQVSTVLIDYVLRQEEIAKDN